VKNHWKGAPEIDDYLFHLEKKKKAPLSAAWRGKPSPISKSPFPARGSSLKKNGLKPKSFYSKIESKT
jgi:hypothetical protein